MAPNMKAIERYVRIHHVEKPNIHPLADWTMWKQNSSKQNGKPIRPEKIPKRPEINSTRSESGGK